MANMIDYAKAYRYTFAEAPFTRVDSLVLSELAYLRYEAAGLGAPGSRITLAALGGMADRPALFDNVPQRDKHITLLQALAVNPRYAGVVAAHYVSHSDAAEEKQFAAIVFHLGDNVAYVAFRGTDASLVGWKEDFNLAVLPTIPAQREGVAYLEAVAGLHPGSALLVGGHSKGGNIAVYAAACCGAAVQGRIRAVYSHDGPGFPDGFYREAGYAAIAPRIDKTVPEFSVVGMLLHQDARYTVVASDQIGPYQHSALSWQIEGGALVERDSITRTARMATNTLNSMNATLDTRQRQMFIDSFFRVLQASEARTLHGLASALATNAPAVVKAIGELTPEERGLLWPVIKTLLAAVSAEVSSALSGRDGPPEEPTPPPQ